MYVGSADPGEAAFTLIEVLIALAIFAVVAVGGIGVLAATDAGGFLEGFPMGFMAARLARDLTVSSVYLQAFHEFAARRGSARVAAGEYCIGSACSPVVPLPSGLAGYPTPPRTGYQLDWTRMDVLIQPWHWDDTSDTDGAGPDRGKAYCAVGTPGCSAVETHEFVTLLRSTLTWQMKGTSRSVTLERFMP